MVSILLGITYAISDELHQTFVPTREGKIQDIFIDMIGMISVAVIYLNIPVAKVKKYL